MKRLDTLVLLLLAGCGSEITSDEIPDYSYAVTVDHPVYTTVASEAPDYLFRSWHFVIISTIRNTGMRTIFLHMCHDTPVRGIGTIAYAEFLDCLEEPMYELRPGHMHTDTTWLSAPRGFSHGQPPDTTGIEGTFRFYYAAYRHPRESGRLLPENRIDGFASAPFTVQRARIDGW